VWRVVGVGGGVVVVAVVGVVVVWRVVVVVVVCCNVADENTFVRIYIILYIFIFYFFIYFFKHHSLCVFSPLSRHSAVSGQIVSHSLGVKVWVGSRGFPLEGKDGGGRSNGAVDHKRILTNKQKKEHTVAEIRIRGVGVQERERKS
jgi:hypothetical protein